MGLGLMPAELVTRAHGGRLRLQACASGCKVALVWPSAPANIAPTTPTTPTTPALPGCQPDQRHHRCPKPQPIALAWPGA
jgi:hypothetical protein